VNKSQLLQKIAALLSQLATTKSFVGQEGYKSDLFKLFLIAAAQNFDIDLGPSNMHADKLLDDLIALGVPKTDTNLKEVWSAWEEWSYCYRKLESSPNNDGTVVAFYVSTNDNGALAYVSDGYAKTIRVRLSELRLLNQGPQPLLVPQHLYPKNAPVSNLYHYKGSLFGR